MKIIKNLTASMSSVSQLQGTCNSLEINLNAYLEKLEAVKNSAGTKVTEATFETNNVDPTKVGSKKITEGGNHSAFIKEKKTAVSIGWQ